MSEQKYPPVRDISRQEALAMLGAGAAIVLVGCGSSSISSSSSGSASSCVLSPNLTIGPYFVDERLNRSDLTTNTTDSNVINGVPLTLNLTVVQYSSSGCSALQDAQVDVWHADAGGVYSDEPVENTLGETYLRGYQVTDAPGLVTFKTIFPGAETSALARATARQRQERASKPKPKLRSSHHVLGKLTQVNFPVHAGLRIIAFCTFFLASTLLLFAQTLKYTRPPNVGNGEHIFRTTCVACHGSDGKGAPQTTAGFERPDTFPDFTRCDQTTPEPNSTWKDVIVHGGPSRGFSQIMPVFGKLLTSEQIDDVIAYLRRFCTNQHWARGELNLPRALVTEKAFPEDEVVISSAANARGAPGVTVDIIHEQRFGMKNQIEIDVPLNFQDRNHTWYGGVGDTTLALKREIFSSLRSGSILSLQGGVLVPTGSRTRGFGSGTTTFETFAAFDQLFRSNTFLQTQLGADLPRHTDIAPQSLFWRVAVGQSFAANRGLGRLWSPMVEFLADRDLTTGAKTNWDIVPEMQVTISRRQHIRANLGVRTPMTNTTGRPVQVMFYLLWDWGDGKLTKGW